MSSFAKADARCSAIRSARFMSLNSNDEFLDLDSYVELIRWYAGIAVDWCGIDAGQEG
ncbi:hypothetical protein Back11_48940 [Paenibacillus baekrokdamisoli]|uniref:Uncharacterized protein n=1 Tax=Paenibacillus baekrokdamisoli TaxID=1712516 RepID=A0A3G9JKH0_9BACL|nr:hypothetical protein Back11_48940 [Paenibacillus baekrokdamisoli]